MSSRSTSNASAARPSYASFRQEFGARLRQLATPETPWPAMVVLTGESDFLLGKSVAAMRDVWQRRAHPESDRSETTSVDAIELAPDGLLDMVLSQSLFEDSQLFVVRRAEKKSEFGKLLMALPDAGQWSNHLVITFEKAALTAEFQRQVKRLGAELIQVAEPVTQADFLQFIAASAQKARIQLTPEAQSLVLQCCGRDVALIENEINRLGLVYPPAAGKPADLGTAEISGVLGVLREDEVFRLDELLINRRHAEAEVLLHHLLERGESVLAVAGVLARHCRNALSIQDEMTRRGRLDMAGMAARLRLPQAVIRNYVRYVPSVPRIRFERALVACAQADVDLKTGGLPDGLALSRIVECFLNN